MKPEPITDQRLDEIEALASKATRGPWWACNLGGEWNVAAPDGDCIAYRICGNLGMDDGTDDEDVAKFVAASRTDVPDLVAEIRRLRLAVAQYQGGSK